LIYNYGNQKTKYLIIIQKTWFWFLLLLLKISKYLPKLLGSLPVLSWNLVVLSSFLNTQKLMVLWAWFFFFQIPRPGGSLIPKHFQIPWTDDEGCLILSIFQIPRTDGSLILNFFKYPEPRGSFFDSGDFFIFLFFQIPIQKSNTRPNTGNDQRAFAYITTKELLNSATWDES